MKNASCYSGFAGYIAGMLLILSASLVMAEMDTNVPMGWAVVPKYGTETTTGGHDGKVVTAKSSSELINYAKSSEPLVIIAEGSFSGTVSVNSNKTIIGAGSGATHNGEIQMGVNTILRNFEITKGRDAIQVNGNKHHVWIDHCDLYACSDGLLDITNESDNVTVSWTKFSDHHKTMLINNGGENANEVDKLNVTLHHLFWNGSDTRNPRCGYGDIHVLNCYYLNNDYGIHMHWETRVHIERNYFKGTIDAVSQHKPGAGTTDKLKMDWDGYPVLVDNKFVDGSECRVESVTDPKKIFDVDKVYMYDWIVTDVNDVPDVVSKGAGTSAEASKIVPVPTPGQGAVKVSTTPTLKWTKVGSEPTSRVYFGKTNPPPEVKTVSGYSYQPGDLDGGTVYYWKINDGDVWKFRVDGQVVAANSPSSKSVLSNADNIQKVISGQSAVLIGVQKGDTQKQFYDLNGRERLNPVAKKQPGLKRD